MLHVRFHGLYSEHTCPILLYIFKYLLLAAVVGRLKRPFPRSHKTSPQQFQVRIKLELLLNHSNLAKA